jgi:LysR family hydrogen peroxide-inducible transcriptional activator
MTLQQLEYIIAVDRERHFVKAAKSCFVTQATLSMMIKKLEEELGIQVFDRRKQPVTVTTAGAEIIKRAKLTIAEASFLKAYAQELTGEVAGELRVGILPTLAPYLLPLFIKSFVTKFPRVQIRVRELITSEIIQNILNNELDIGIVATPLENNQIVEHPLFYEEFMAYSSSRDKLPNKQYLLAKDIDLNDLWLLEEGHCLRGQLVNLCSLKAQESQKVSLHYEAGSLESLVNLVDRYGGITILPKLATLRLSPAQKKKLRAFARPMPSREVSLITSLHFARKRLAAELSDAITFSVKKYLDQEHRDFEIVAVN